MRRLLFALLLLAALIAGATSALAEKRLALVIGNDAYQQVPPLSKAATDANAIASALRKLDFTVTVAREPVARGAEPIAAIVRHDDRTRRHGVLFLRRAWL